MTDYIDTNLPLRRVALFSSGVGFFERSATMTGAARIQLPFLAEDVSDALKSLTILDPDSRMPSVTYPAEDTLDATLGSLKPDLSNNPGIGGLLNALRGASLEVISASGTLTGRILGVEERFDADYEIYEHYLSLYSDGSVQIIPAKTILTYRFLDEEISADIERAMDVLLGAATSKLRNLEVRLDADTTREVSVAYVCSSPVWKAAYRLDLASEPAFLQSWAIVDNSSDVDWKDVELSLLVGRPSSFTQKLYQPYYVEREDIPLAIAGSAAARVYDAILEEAAPEMMRRSSSMAAMSMSMASVGAVGASPQPMGSMLERSAQVTAATQKAAGEQFAFTFTEPVTINRHQSAMLPLNQGAFTARKMSILSGQSLSQGQQASPALGVQVTNDTGTGLPAGPITVFDDGLYAGDALLEYLPDGANRLISYGDDLAVRAALKSSTTNNVVSVRLARGVLQATVSVLMRTEYMLSNDSAKARRILVEHPRVGAEELVQPAKADELTASLYHFETMVDPGQTATFIVEVKRMGKEEYAVIDGPRSVLVHYSSRGLPEKMRATLEHAADLKERQYQIDAELASLQATEERVIADQARVRENLSAVGASTRSGAGYQARLDELEDRLVELSTQMEALRQASDEAAAELSDYIAQQDFTEDV